MKRALFRSFVAVLVAVLLVAVFFVAAGWTAFGRGAGGERLERIKRSKQWDGSKFENPQPLWNDFSGSLLAFLDASPHVAPLAEVPVVRGGEVRFATPPAGGLRITWF